MKKTLLFLILVLLAGLVFPDKVVPLREIQKPQSITVDKDQFYITEGANIYIYSLSDFRLKKKFGKQGEGPKELKPVPQLEGAKLQITVRDNDIVVFSMNKISFYSKNGDYLKEVKAVFGTWHKPLGHNYIGRANLMENKIVYFVINIYDPDFNKINEVFRFKSVNQQGKDINPIGVKPSIYYIYNNKIFIDSKRNGIIQVSDLKGNKLYDINVKLEKVPVTAADREGYYNYYKNHPLLKYQFETVKHRIKFPQQFPYFKYFIAADNKIYVQSYKKKDGKSQFFIYDLKGKLLEDVYLPIVQENASEDYPYTIMNGKLYQINEDTDRETWALHITEIK